MPRLPAEIPAWAREYTGREYSRLGEGSNGLGCWALVRLVYAERFGVYLPGLSDHFAGIDDVPGLARALEAERGPGGSGWRAVPGGAADAQLGDVAHFTIAGGIPHVGVLVARDRVLHALPGCETCTERIDTPVWRRRLVEVLRLEAAPVRLVGRARPFAGPRIDASLPPGLSLAEILQAAGVPSTPGLRVFVGGGEVASGRWGNVRPRPGRLVTIACTPAGGDKSALRIIATIAIIAAAAFAPYLLLGAKAAGAGITVAGLSANALISGGVAIGGGLLLNALAPPPRPRLSAGDESASPTIAGARNEARPYATVPQVLGYHRLVPPYAALPYTENAGDDQYIRMLFAWYGPTEISDIRIGDTPIDEYEGVEVEIREGWEGDDPIGLYPSIAHEEPLSLLLEQAAGWTLRTSRPDSDELSVDVTFPAGLASIDAAGGRGSRTVDVDVEFSPAGLNSWRRINGDGGPIASPTSKREMDLLFRTPEVQRGGFVLSAPSLTWGFAGGKPAYLPATGYSWTVSGRIRDQDAPENGGYYRFSIDSSDAADLFVDGRLVCSFYGTHPTAGGGTPSFDGQQSNLVRLRRGNRLIQVRMEARSTAGAIAVAWKKPGASSWAPITTDDLAIIDGGRDTFRGAWYRTDTYISEIRTTSNRTVPMRRTLAWAVPRGQYDVRLRRLTDDTDDERIIDDVFWTALRSFSNEDPVRIPHTARLAVRIRATDQLSGVIDNLSAMVRSIVPDWEPSSGQWITRATNNPASLYRWILQGRANARPLADARLDLAELRSWHEACALEGFTFNGVLDFPGTVYERLSDVAAAGRASFGLRDGKFSVVRDRPQTAPAQYFTPRNSSGFSATIGFPDLPHALRVQFLDETRGFVRDERLVLADGYTVGGRDAFGALRPELPAATRFETLELFGVTEPGLVWRHGRYHLAVLQLRPELASLTADFEHLACTRGDLVLVSHDVPQWGLGSGRIGRLNLDTSGNLVGVDLDDEVVMDAGDTFVIRIRLAGGGDFLRPVATSPGTHRRLTLSNPVAAGEPWPEAGDLYMFGRVGQETRELLVQAIEPGEDLSARLTFVDHSPGVHLADQGEIPPWEPGISQPPAWQDGPEVPSIAYIQSNDWVMVRLPDGSMAPRILVVVTRPAGTRPLPSHYQLRLRPSPASGGTPGPWRTMPLYPADDPSLFADQVEVGLTYQLRVRAVTAAGRASAWAQAEHTVEGNVLRPPDVQSFDVQRLADGTRKYRWVLGVIPPDIAGVLIRYGPSASSPTWEQMVPLHEGVLDAASPQEFNDPIAGAWRFGIKMIDVAGNESLNMTTVDRVLGRPRRPNSIATVDARVEGWPGAKVSCFVTSPGPMLEANDLATWATLGPVHGKTSWANWTRWNVEPSSPIRYTHPAIDLGAVVSSAPEVSVVVTGSAVVEFRSSQDGAAYTAWADYETLRGVAVEARYHQWRVSVTQTGEQPVPTIRELVMDAIAEPQEQFIDDLDTAALAGNYRLGVGDVRIPIDVTRFMVIRGVTLTFNGAGAGRMYSIVDKDRVIGPRVRILTESGSSVDAVVDVTVRGF